jgi:hypothetical protein
MIFFNTSMFAEFAYHSWKLDVKEFICYIPKWVAVLQVGECFPRVFGMFSLSSNLTARGMDFPTSPSWFR